MSAPVILSAGNSTPGRLGCVDVNLTSPLNTTSPVWTPIQFVESYNFNPDEPAMVDATVFGDAGFSGQDKLGAAWSLALTLNHMSVPGSNPPSYDPTHDFLEANAVGVFGAGNRVQLRMYDFDLNDVSGVLTPRGKAYTGFANYSWPRYGDTGQADARKVQLTFMGKGKLTAITHPYPLTPVAPVITSVTPATLAASGSAGKQVVVAGSGFATTVANGVKIGGVNALSYVVESDNRIVVSVPTTAAGASTVTVQNSVGTSSAATLTFT